MTRLPRIMLQLTTALQYTPTDHPDQEGIPALTDSLSRIIKGSQVCHRPYSFNELVRRLLGLDTTLM